MLFDELLLVQYLVSRSHKAGGLTLEGRYTLHELFVRLRNSGYLRTVAVQTHNPGDALEVFRTHEREQDVALFYFAKAGTPKEPPPNWRSQLPPRVP